jgi:hypothetical protein
MTGFNSKREAAADKLQEPYDQTALELCNVCGWKTLIPDDGCLNCERAQPAQEPLHIVQSNGRHSPLLTHMMSKRTTPPQRPWVDLSDSQIERVYHDVAKLHRGAAMPWGQVQFGRALQALIKERNS